MDLHRNPAATDAESARRASAPGPAARWLLTPWTVDDVCQFLRCTDRWLRKVRKDATAGFPAPLRTAQLAWWPGDVLAWCGISLPEALYMAEALDSSRASPATSSGDGR